ncbi:hypothetical protein AURDEDRAFT_137943 [Auricularia subglabra TFB-10046 SS5]|nr:hypothetical protein AURDEDRAFT_137943 [Auricularia subglabra TFB-10046 SS5]
MVSTSLFAIVSTAVASVCASTPSSSGTHDGYYYNLQTDGGGDISYNNLAGGRYNVIWTGKSGNFLGGKGWKQGSARNITYASYYRPLGTSSLSIYGWTSSPLVEYSIVEDYFGTYTPASHLSHKGTVISDGATYDIYGTHPNGPRNKGTGANQQYVSVRQQARGVGRVTTANHFNAWKSAGLPLGAFDYQIVATEGHLSAGSATVEVSSPA